MPRPKRGSKVPKLHEIADAARMNVGVAKSAYATLARQVQGKEAKAGEIANWVMNNIHSDPAAINPEEVPSPSAVALLEYAQDNPGAFIENIWSKLMPSRQQIETQERFRDDGKNALELVVSFQEDFEREQAEMSEGDGGEPALPAEDSGTDSR